MMKRILTLTAAAALAACSGSKGEKGDPGTPGTPATPAGPTYGTPGTGLNYEITKAVVVTDQKPTITFKVTDAAGKPLELKGSDGTLAWTPSFVLAKLGADGKFTSFLTRQATGSTWTDAAGNVHNPALAKATQAASESSSGTAGAARVAATGEAGVYTYTFANAATNADVGATLRAGVYGNRTVNGVAYPASATFDWVPAGGTPATNELVKDDACNACHQRVRAHGDQRLGVKLCVTCHSPQTIDPETGNNVDMALLIHKIHNGANLKNEFAIVGFGGNPAPTPLPRSAYFPVNEIKMPPSHGTSISGGSDPGIVKNCTICHQGANADKRFTTITASACQTCHDSTDVRTGANHGVPNPTTGQIPSGVISPQPDDSACVNCHGTTGIQNAQVATVHSEFYDNRTKNQFAAHKLEVKITNVAFYTPGLRPQVDFTVTLDGAPMNIKTTALSSLAFQAVGPTTDNAFVVPTTLATASNIGVSPGASSALTSGLANPAVVTDVDPAGGKFRFTFPATAPMPATAKGTWVFSYEASYGEAKTSTSGTATKIYAANPVFHDGKDAAGNAVSKNVFYANVENPSGTTTQRRAIAATDKCNNCHEDIGFHGNRGRKGIDYCATCHNPNLDNRGRLRFTGPVGRTVKVESVSTNVFIHRIHAGAELGSVQEAKAAFDAAGTPGVFCDPANNNYQPGCLQYGTVRTATVAGPVEWGTAEAAFSNFSELELPSPIVNCSTCHLANTWALNTDAVLPVRRAIVRCDAVGGSTQDPTYCSTRSVAQETFTPPQQAVCTSCHDTAAAGAHADLNTVNPMRANAIETCGACHDAGKDFDAVKMHPPVLIPSVDIPDTTP